MDHKAATSVNWFFQQAEHDEKIHFQAQLNPSFHRWSEEKNKQQL